MLACVCVCAHSCGPRRAHHLLLQGKSFALTIFVGCEHLLTELICSCLRPVQVLAQRRHHLPLPFEFLCRRVHMRETFDEIKVVVVVVVVVVEVDEIHHKTAWGRNDGGERGKRGSRGGTRTLIPTWRALACASTSS